MVSSEIVNDRYEDNRSMSLLARDQYEREVTWFEVEPLSPEDERKYWERILRARNDPLNRWLLSLAKDARGRLTEYYQSLLRGIVRGYARRPCGLDFLDLVQEANIGLLRAFDTCPFDMEKGTFAGWVTVCVQVALRKVCYEKSGFVRLGDRLQKAIADVAAVEQRYRFSFGRLPVVSELSSELGLTCARVYELLHYRRLQEVESIEAMSEQYEISEDHYSFQEMYRSFSDSERARSDALTERVEDALSQLSPRQRQVLQLRYGLCGESSSTEKEVSDLLGIQVRGVETMAYTARKRLRVVLASLYEEEQVAV